MTTQDVIELVERLKKSGIHDCNAIADIVTAFMNNRPIKPEPKSNFIPPEYSSFYSPELKKAQEDLTKAVQERMKLVMAQREEILEAFIAKYGFQPDETVQIIQDMRDGNQRFWVEKKQK